MVFYSESMDKFKTDKPVETADPDVSEVHAPPSPASVLRSRKNSTPQEGMSL